MCGSNGKRLQNLVVSTGWKRVFGKPSCKREDEINLDQPQDLRDGMDISGLGCRTEADCSERCKELRISPKGNEFFH